MIPQYVLNYLLYLMKEGNVYVRIEPSFSYIIDNESLPPRSSTYFVAVSFFIAIFIGISWFAVLLIQKYRLNNTKRFLNVDLKKILKINRIFKYYNISIKKD